MDTENSSPIHPLLFFENFYIHGLYESLVIDFLNLKDEEPGWINYYLPKINPTDLSIEIIHTELRDDNDNLLPPQKETITFSQRLSPIVSRELKNTKFFIREQMVKLKTPSERLEFLNMQLGILAQIGDRIYNKKKTDLDLRVLNTLYSIIYSSIDILKNRIDPKAGTNVVPLNNKFLQIPKEYLSNAISQGQVNDFINLTISRLYNCCMKLDYPLIDSNTSPTDFKSIFINPENEIKIIWTAKKKNGKGGTLMLWFFIELLPELKIFKQGISDEIEQWTFIHFIDKDKCFFNKKNTTKELKKAIKDDTVNEQIKKMVEKYFSTDI